MHAGVVQSDVKLFSSVQDVPVKLCCLPCQHALPFGEPPVTADSTPEAANLE